MTWSRLLLRSLLFQWRTGAVVTFGLALATAVITGSLLLGDSVTGSLRDTALARLGSVDHALLSPHFFREQLAADLARSPQLAGQRRGVAAAVLLPGAARSGTSQATVPRVSIIGVDEGAWALLFGGPIPLSGRAAAINEALASDLGLRQGETLLVTVGRPSAAPVETLFARRKREETVQTLRLTVAQVLSGGPGDFRLDPSPLPPRNVFVSRAWLMRLLGHPDQANLLLVHASPSAETIQVEALQQALGQVCRLEDYALRLAPDAVGKRVSLQAAAVVLPQAIVSAAQQAAAQARLRAGLTSVYLATTIRNLSARPPTQIAYAVLAGLKPAQGLTLRPGGRVLDGEGLLLNAWAAEQLQAKVGDSLEVAYLVPTAEGDYPTRRLRLVVRGIVEMSGAGADPALTPDFEGITDAERMQDWKPPFPVNLGLITPQDEAYWQRYRAAPKAFVALDTVRAMWQSGGAGADADWVTSVWVLPGARSLAQAQEAFGQALRQRLTPDQAGMVFAPVRQLGLEAARGTTDFSQLMLGMSSFLVLAGAGLAGMLMRLSAQRRAREVGLLLACGIRSGRAGTALLAEGAILTLLGVLAGVPLGVLYAWAIIRALTSWWSGAIASTALWLHVEPLSLAIGAAAGLAVGLLSVAWGVRNLRGRGVLELLAGWQSLVLLAGPRCRRLAAAILLLCVTGMGLLLYLSLGSGRLSAVPAFFGSGALLLGGGLAALWWFLARLLPARREARTLLSLALRSAAGSRGRSLLTAGLLAAAAFVVVTVAANTRDFSGRGGAHPEYPGAGGFALRAVSTLPLPYDLGTPGGRARLGFAPADERIFASAEVLSLLESPGEDISCLNLARPTAPRVLGVSRTLIAQNRFPVLTETYKDNPWQLLGQPLSDGAIPAFGDADSVRWSLHSGLGKEYVARDEQGKPVRLRFVGLLPGSIFAGELLVSEDNFRRLYPSVRRPRYFLIGVPPGGPVAEIAQSLRATLGDLGLEVQTTADLLNAYARVQNTYLSMFLALGGLGMLLGTVGLVTVVLRGALERRGQFALMLATGFRSAQLISLLVLENAGLLALGLALGAGCALISVLPQIWTPIYRPHWAGPAGLLTGMMALGIAACALAARAGVRGNLLEALREE